MSLVTKQASVYVQYDLKIVGDTDYVDTGIESRSTP